MHTLYGAASGNSLRAAISLHEAGIPFEAVRVDLAGGEQRAAAFKALNPHGKVPVLVRQGEGGQVITQSNAIMMYADGQGGTQLLPASGPARWTALERFFYFVTDVIVVGHSGFYLRQTGDASMTPAADWLSARSRAAAASAERFLGDSAHISGDSLGLADIAAFTVIGSMRQDLDWNALPRTKDWHARLAERPAFREGMGAFRAR